MSSMLILKFIMLLIMDYSILGALVPPNKPGPSDKVETTAYGEKYMTLIRKFTMLPNILCPNIILSMVLLLTFFGPKDISAKICPKDAVGELQRLSPAFLGAFAVIAGANIIRQICYRTLGKFFTYEITIRPQHKIIDVGPYAVVRHSSYTGLFMLVYGSGGLVFTTQNPAITCGWAASYFSVRVLMGLWFTWAVYMSYWILNRVSWEERTLRSHFGRAWDDYTKRVPYKFIPGIL